MNPESIQKIIDAIEKNGGAGLDALAAHEKALAALNIVGVPVLVVALILVIVFARRRTAHFMSTDENLTALDAMSVFITAISVIIIFFAMLSLPGNIAAYTNPKGAAIKSLIERR